MKPIGHARARACHLLGGKPPGLSLRRKLRLLALGREGRVILRTGGALATFELDHGDGASPPPGPTLAALLLDIRQLLWLLHTAALEIRTPQRRKFEGRRKLGHAQAPALVPSAEAARPPRSRPPPAEPRPKQQAPPSDLPRQSPRPSRGDASLETRSGWLRCACASSLRACAPPRSGCADRQRRCRMPGGPQ